MTRRLWVGFASAVLVGLGLTSARAETRRLSLAEAQHLAVQQYEAVRLAKAGVDQARLVRRQAFGAVLPNVTLSGTYTRNLVPAEFEFGGRRIQVLPGNDYNVGVSFSQPLYAGLRELRTLRQAEVSIEAAGVAVGLSVQDTVLNVTRSYYRVLGAQEYVEISRRALEVARATLRTAESLYRAGEAVETAVLRARVAVGDAERQLVDAENNLALARDALRLLVGTTDEIEVTRPEPPARPTASVDELVRQGLERRLELRNLDLQYRIAQLEVEKRKGAFLPIVRADGSVTQRRATFPSSRIGSVAVNATWNLFNGGRTGAEVAAAETALRELELRRALLRKQTENEIRSAYLRIETLATTVEVLERQVELARRNADETARAYRVGEATDLDILTANNLAARAERDLLDATYAYELAMYELQRAIGALAPDLVAAAAAEGDPR
jgi:outer membrane protein